MVGYPAFTQSIHEAYCALLYDNVEMCLSEKVMHDGAHHVTSEVVVTAEQNQRAGHTLQFILVKRQMISHNTAFP